MAKPKAKAEQDRLAEFFSWLASTTADLQARVQALEKSTPPHLRKVEKR